MPGGLVMNAKHKLVGAAILACCTATSAGASEYSIGIFGEVPVICRATVDATATVDAQGNSALGQLNEFCNSAGGYRVFVEHSADLTGASLVVDGKAIPLANEGGTLISSSPTAARATHSLALAGSAAANGTLVFRIEPL